ncbi:sterol desaturase/sphingolipid hydroxylase (fatty acid hydroxylase superfamily) [Jatrophihabitans sp. GAS493]|uniref:sterol desaturase family protein n=1 Tax=Jatrophihabitans sp. GAS493 TaxID=1907575 RepID=UPI000BB8D6A3|nr:sterol desaturase family protein [Jatrophihabitans sp. GAS493]SOD70558.1 sterol desaturase/sphingolipid hydroxylase (fatty acid hydroxylase superfamily) [Jatrophihabitans sp. GAS493]
MPEQLRDPLVFAIPFFILFMVIEVVSMRFLDDEDDRFVGYERRDSRTNIAIGLGSLVINGAARFAALLLYSVLYAITPLRIDPHNWWSWVVVLLGVDLIWYSYHRASHRVRLLWAGHQVHHNSQRFNLSTAVRQKWNPWFELLCWVPLPLLGVPPWMIFFSFSINLIFQFFVHTERIGRLPKPVEYVFNTPSHHRVHHASDPEYLDRNYGGILIVWDRMFGSYAEEQRRPTYGLTKNIDSFNPLRLQYYEYGAIVSDVRRAQSWRERIGYVVAPPGWTPAATTAPEATVDPADGRVAPPMSSSAPK